jgi:MoxR-like ATPase
MQAKVPVLVWGPPGAGKTATVNAVASELGLALEVVIASVREPSDFAGLPVVRESGVSMEPPAWARRLVQAGGGALFFDEISTAPPAVQAALLRVVLDRVVGDLALPDNVGIIAAANPPEQAAGGWDLSAPLANRFCHLTWQLDTEAWIDGMVHGWSDSFVRRLPDGWEQGIPAQRALVASFIHLRRDLLLAMPESYTQLGMAWPSPRSWDMAARLMAAARAATSDEDALARLVIGCVGDGAGLEFLAWYKALDLPDPETLLRNPDEFELPSRGDQAFAVLASVVTAVTQKPSKARWLAAWTIMDRAASQGGKDIAASAARSLVPIRDAGWPLPQEQLRAFIPVLIQAGLLSA